MAENEPEVVAEEVIEEEPEVETPVETEDPTELKNRIRQLEEKAIAQRERTKILRQEMAKLKKPETAKEVVESKAKTGELDETQLDYLDLKGISESEDIAVIEGIVKKTGQTVRQALKDEYVIAKLEANKAKRDVKAATPSSTKRSGGGQSNELDAAIAKYEQSGFKELPQDFALRAKVVEAMVERTTQNKPAWRS